MLIFGCRLDGAEKKQHILLLNSYNRGFPWTDSIVNSIETKLYGSGIPVELHVEYMDTKRFSGDNYYSLLFRQFLYKYGSMKISCIISTDDDALNFLEKYHPSLFPGTPVVFCGINNLGVPARVDRKIFTGIMEEQSPASTIDLMLRLHPDTKKIYVVCDFTTTGRARFRSVEAVKGTYKNIRFVFNGDEPFGSTLKEIGGLKKKSLVLLMAYYRDSDGINYTYEGIMRSILPQCRVPVYSVAVNYLGYGVVGGVMNSPEKQGCSAADMCLGILNGAKPSAIPLITDIDNPVMIDYAAASRFSIDGSRIPGDAVFINRPTGFMNFYRANRIYVLYILLASLLVIVTILGTSFGLLLKADRKRKKLVIELEEALTKVRTLSGLLPICSSCRKIRDDSGYWQMLEGYLKEHSGVEFTHSICPDCARKLYPGIMDKKNQGEHP